MLIRSIVRHDTIVSSLQRVKCVTFVHYAETARQRSVRRNRRWGRIGSSAAQIGLPGHLAITDRYGASASVPVATYPCGLAASYNLRMPVSGTCIADVARSQADRALALMALATDAEPPRGGCFLTPNHTSRIAPSSRGSLSTAHPLTDRGYPASRLEYVRYRTDTPSISLTIALTNLHDPVTHKPVNCVTN
jgi:hypothetical protein